MRTCAANVAAIGDSDVKKLLVLVGTTIGGAVGWWIGDRVGIMTAFMLSMVGTGLGMYVGVRIARQYEP